MMGEYTMTANSAVDSSKEIHGNSGLVAKSFYGKSTRNYSPLSERLKQSSANVNNNSAAPKAMGSEASTTRKRPLSGKKSPAVVKRRNVSASNPVKKSVRSSGVDQEESTPVKPPLAAKSEMKENSPRKSPRKTPSRFFKHRNSSPSKLSRVITGVSVELHKGFKVQVNLQPKQTSPIPAEKPLMSNRVFARDIPGISQNCGVSHGKESSEQKAEVKSNEAAAPDSGCDMSCDAKGSSSDDGNQLSGQWSTQSTASDSVAPLSEVSTSACSSPISESSVINGDIDRTPKKRKLFPIFENVRRSPRMHNKKSTPKQKSPKHLLKSLRDKDGREQLTLDFGQRLIGVVECNTCGMAYTHGEPTDEATHLEFHQCLQSALKFPGWKNERVVQEYFEGRIIVVLPHERVFMKKVMAIRGIMDQDLGFVVEEKALDPSSKTFLYISHEHQVVGCCVAQVITQGYRVLDPDSSHQSGSRQPLCCSDQAEHACCGINRIWVLQSHRRQGIATRLLDAVRNHFMLAHQIQKSEIAFTDPTPTGKLLAASYCQTPNFLVYKQ